MARQSEAQTQRLIHIRHGIGRKACQLLAEAVRVYHHYIVQADGSQPDAVFRGISIINGKSCGGFADVTEATMIERL